jgi:hypothetical protein
VFADAAEMVSSRACWLATCQDTAAGRTPQVLLNMPMSTVRPSGVGV